MISKSAKTNMNRRRKGIATFMLLFLVVGFVAAIILFGSYFSFVFKIINIKGQINIFMVNDDAGTELVSLLNAKTGNVKHIEVLGRYVNEDSDINPVKETLYNAYKNYDFSFNGIGSVDFKKGVPLVIQDETRTAIIGCGSSPVAGDIIQLSWPLSPDLKTVTSGFGPRDLGNKGVCSCHAGIDIASPRGSEVHAVALGIVSKVSEDPTSGKYVRVEHEFGPNKNKYYSYYMHLDKVSDSLVIGQEVNSTIVIGLSGNTGVSTGPHLHFEFRKSSEAPSQKGEYSINPCGLFFDKNGNKMAIDKCEQEKVSACSYVSGMISGKSVRSYDTDVPLPGAKSGNVKGTVVFKQWD